MIIKSYHIILVVKNLGWFLLKWAGFGELLGWKSSTRSGNTGELSRLNADLEGLCRLVLITLSGNYEKEGCETWSALPFWRSHCLDFWGASRFGVIAVYRWMCNEYRKQNQLNPPLCVPYVLRACTCLPCSYSILNLTQAVRTDPYAKMEMLAWTFDIYI